MSEKLLLLCWVIYYSYWILAARFTKQTEKVDWNAGNIWWNAGIVVAFLLLRNVFRILPHSPIVTTVSLLLVILGMIVAIYARLMLAGNWSKDVVLKKDHTLITTGVYTYIRHPIYSGFLLMALGTAIFMGSVGELLLLSVLATFLWIKLQKEEELFLKHFPNEYASYKKRSKALIPFIL